MEQACDLCKCMAAEDDSPALVCNACKHVWCGKCNVAWHSNKSCDEYQRECGEKAADKGLEEYKRGHRMIKCPTCGHGIEKIDGCNRVQCSGCKTQCCWLCGKKIPATNPYSHFTSKGCATVGGGAQAQGTGVPAGAWAAVPVEPARPAAQPGQAVRAAIQQAEVALPAAPMPLPPRPQPLGPGDAVDAVIRVPALQPSAAAAAPARAPAAAPAPAPPRAKPAPRGRGRKGGRARGRGRGRL